MMVRMRASIPLTCLLLCWLLWQAACRAQMLNDLLVSTAVNNLDIPAATDAAANILPNLASPDKPTYSALPRCQNTNVLLNRGAFPSAWGMLSAEQQVAHPINLVMMQLAYAAYQPPDTFRGCLAAMGIDPNSITAVTVDVPQYQTTRSALVMKAGKERIFITFMGSNFLGGRDLTINFDCKQTLVDAGTFGAHGKQLGLHTGFYTGWQALKQGVTSAVTQVLNEVPSGEVYVVGHSLGAALASLAALQLDTLLPKGRAHVQGVWLFGCPRVGDPEWARAYDTVLLRKTLRVSNYRDFAVRAPRTTQVCSVSGSATSLTLEAFAVNSDTSFQFRHVGQQVLMCPNTQTGLTDWKIYSSGSENLDCGTRTRDESDYSGGTHVLGAYFDAWRRGYLAYRRSTASTLASDPRIKAVMCQQCVATEPYILNQMMVPARAGGPVTCSIDENCSKQAAFSAATAVASVYSMSWAGSGSSCRSFRCTG